MDEPTLKALIIKPDDPIHAAFITEDGTALYTVSTSRTSRGSAISVRDTLGRNVATLETIDIGLGSTKVRLGEGRAVAYGQWLSRSLVPFERDVKMKDDQGRKYKWRESGPRRTLELFIADDQAHPIAMYSRTTQEDGSMIATLSLDARAEEIRDQVVASFVFLERERRARQRQTENRVLSVALASTDPGLAYALR